MKYFDKAEWREAARHADWYIRIKPDYDRLLERVKSNPDIAEDAKEEVRSFFEDLIESGGLVVGGPMPELDRERQPIDTAVVHHTSQPPDLSLERLNVIHLLNIYAPYFADPSAPEDQHLRGASITSNHFHDDKVAFFGYHWLVRMDGTTTRLLQDSAIGWHAGNWAINRRSVGICLDNDYEETAPTTAVLRSVADLLKEHYSQIPTHRVVGHREVNETTICPGNLFLSVWKPRLLSLLKSAPGSSAQDPDGSGDVLLAA